MLEVRNMTKIYSRKDSEIQGIENINLTFNENGMVFVLGESGSGKTTFLNAISGMLELTEGQVIYNDCILNEYREKQFDYFRNIASGFVFQDYHLIEDLSVRDNLELSLAIIKSNSEMRCELIEESLRYVDMLKYMDAKVSELSGGQKQRVAIARAIIKKPRIIFADEPTGNLDPENSELIFELLRMISDNCLVIAVSHDLQAAYRYGDRIIKLKHGHIESDIDNRSRQSAKRFTSEIELRDETGTFVHKWNRYEEAAIEEAVFEHVGYHMEQDKAQKMFHYQLHISTKANNKDETEKSKQVRPEHLEKRMSSGTIMRYIRYYLGRTGFRVVLTMLLLAFICAIGFTVILVKHNDYTKAICEYLINTDKRFLSISQNAVYVNWAGAETYRELRNGSLFRQDILAAVGSSNFYNAVEDVLVSDSIESSKAVYMKVMFYNSKEEIPQLEVEGRFPDSADEIALDFKAAQELGVVELGTQVYMSGTDIPVTVVGFIQRSILDSQFVSIMSSDFIEYQKGHTTTLYIEADNPLEANSIDRYTTRAAVIGSIEQLQNSDILLLRGQLPSADYEILISEDFAFEYGIDIDHFQQITYRIPNIKDKKYNGVFDNQINLYDYIGNEITVTGVFRSSDSGIEIMYTDEIYRTILREFYEDVYFSASVIRIDDVDLHQFIDFLKTHGYFLDDPMGHLIRDFQNAMNKLNQGLLVVEGIGVVMVILLLAYYVTFCMHDRLHSVGVMRALGVSRWDISAIFIGESFGICLSSCILSVPLIYGSFCYMNAKMNSFLETDILKVFLINPSYLFFMCSLMVFVGVLLTAVPIYKMTLKKPIYVLNHK